MAGAILTVVVIGALVLYGVMGTPISDRQLAWCLRSPGGIAAIATDSGISIPQAAQATVDEGIYDHADRWRFHDAWSPSTYSDLCGRAYEQFGGAEAEVDMSVLDVDARSESPAPTPNMSTRELRARARVLIPSLREGVSELRAALLYAETSDIATAASRVRGLTDPESEALDGAVAEPCFEDAGAAYGLTVFWADAAANHAIEGLNSGDPDWLDLALSATADAATYSLEFERLDASAIC